MSASKPSRKRSRQSTKSGKTQQLHWKDMLVLQPGETPRFVSRTSEGNLGQSEIELHEIVDAAGNVSGSVRVWEHTSLKPPHLTTCRIEQLTATGELIRRWQS